MWFCVSHTQVAWEDSPLVRAAILGRVLIVDEADKAPTEVCNAYLYTLHSHTRTHAHTPHMHRCLQTQSCTTLNTCGYTHPHTSPSLSTNHHTATTQHSNTHYATPSPLYTPSPPTQVVCVIKALLEDGEMLLPGVLCSKPTHTCTRTHTHARTQHTHTHTHTHPPTHTHRQLTYTPHAHALAYPCTCRHTDS